MGSRVALMLSGGVLFGAYQAGAWKALAGVLKPDHVVGASVGALNGWAIASGVDRDELIEQWLTIGKLTPGMVRGRVEELVSKYTPKLPFSAALTQLYPLKPCLFHFPEIGAAHLLASCSVPGAFPPVSIDGVRYVDGGILGALPLWAIEEIQATQVVAIDVMAGLPEWYKRGVGMIKSAAGFRATTLPPGVQMHLIAPAKLLGGFQDVAVWSEANTKKWIEQGRDDALRWIDSAKGTFPF